MNAKKVKAIRKHLKSSGIIHNAAEYVSNGLNKSTYTLKQGCGRSIYKGAKRTAKGLGF